jgi:hypothetical protein
MYNYQYMNNADGGVNQDAIKRLPDCAIIPFDPENTDYQAYLKFLADGGQPLPADDNGQTA